MRRLPLLGIVLALLLFVLPALGENRILLVGCDQFLTQPDTTPIAANNVALISSAFSASAAVPAAVVTRVNEVATADDLSALIDDVFGEADADDVSYFFISTHGVWTDQTDNSNMVLLLSDGVTQQGVNALQLRTYFDRIPGKKVLLIDACHSGAMIGKGTTNNFNNLFADDDYIVICSSGGAEQSWFWSGEDDTTEGAGYFTSALAAGISAYGGYGADTNRDGTITLSDLRRYLLSQYGVSTPRFYPEYSDFPILQWSGSPAVRSTAALTSVSFDAATASGTTPSISFSYSVQRPVRVAYQLVYRSENAWDFGDADLLWDDVQGAGEVLSPGYKERTITIDRQDAGSWGYVLVQVLTLQNDQPSVTASKVICIPPMECAMEPSVLCSEAFCPLLHQEFSFAVLHDYPCELTVTVQDADGNTVYRFPARQASRPEQLSPDGTCFTWPGTLQDGSPAPGGSYVIRVKTYAGSQLWETVSTPFLLASSAAG